MNDRYNPEFFKRTPSEELLRQAKERLDNIGTGDFKDLKEKLDATLFDDDVDNGNHPKIGDQLV